MSKQCDSKGKENMDGGNDTRFAQIDSAAVSINNTNIIALIDIDIIYNCTFNVGCAHIHIAAVCHNHDIVLHAAAPGSDPAREHHCNASRNVDGPDCSLYRW